MEDILISVIMANYNTPIEYLKEAIDSILNQTYSDFEFIIIDDCSTDSSIDIIKDYQDARIKIVENDKNIGLTKSLNKGLRYAKGKYIARMDSDDISLPNRFQRQIEYLECHPEVIVCGTWFEKFGVENIIRKPVIEDNELYRCQLLFSNTPITMCHPSVMIRKSFLERYSLLYDEEIKKAQDYAFWVKCSRFGEMAIIREVLLEYRTHLNQISIGKKEEQYSYADLVSRKQLQELGIDYQVEEKRWRYNVVTDRDDYLHFFEWLHNILIANEKHKEFIPDKLQEYVNSKLEKALKRMKRIDLLKVWFTSNKPTRTIILSLVKNRVRYSIK